jgi:hypothetical protein
VNMDDDIVAAFVRGHEEALTRALTAQAFTQAVIIATYLDTLERAGATQSYEAAFSSYRMLWILPAPADLAAEMLG